MADLPAALLGIGVLACIVVMGYLFTHAEPLSPLLSGAKDEEARFQAYVKRELHKAQVGAANAESWANDLVAAWDKAHMPANTTRPVNRSG